MSMPDSSWVSNPRNFVLTLQDALNWKVWPEIEFLNHAMQNYVIKNSVSLFCISTENEIDFVDPSHIVLLANEIDIDELSGLVVRTKAENWPSVIARVRWSSNYSREEAALLAERNASFGIAVRVFGGPVRAGKANWVSVDRRSPVCLCLLGESGTGKSTTARRLGEAGLSVVHGDDAIFGLQQETEGGSHQALAEVASSGVANRDISKSIRDIFHAGLLGEFVDLLLQASPDVIDVWIPSEEWRNFLAEVELRGYRAILGVNEAAVAERDAALSLTRQFSAERDALIAERDAALSLTRQFSAERDALIAERDAALSLGRQFASESEALVVERDAAWAERDRLLRRRSVRLALRLARSFRWVFALARRGRSG